LKLERLKPDLVLKRSAAPGHSFVLIEKLKLENSTNKLSFSRHNQLAEGSNSVRYFKLTIHTNINQIESVLQITSLAIQSKIVNEVIRVSNASDNYLFLDRFVDDLDDGGGVRGPRFC
jgi:hypothetical protein